MIGLNRRSASEVSLLGFRQVNFRDFMKGFFPVVARDELHARTIHCGFVLSGFVVR